MNDRRRDLGGDRRRGEREGGETCDREREREVTDLEDRDRGRAAREGVL